MTEMVKIVILQGHYILCYEVILFIVYSPLLLEAGLKLHIFVESKANVIEKEDPVDGKDSTYCVK